jgi:hypothetical protein
MTSATEELSLKAHRRKSEVRQRQQIAAARLSDAEMQQVKAVAAKNGKTVSAFMRELALSAV